MSKKKSQPRQNLSDLRFIRTFLFILALFDFYRFPNLNAFSHINVCLLTKKDILETFRRIIIEMK